VKTEMGEITTITRTTTTKTKSIKSTIPTGIASHFNLVPGDQLEWFIISKDNKLCIRVEPRKKP